MTVEISYDEKTGIQGLQNAAPDLPPVPGEHSTWGRDHEYIRHGTVSLLAGMDLRNGTVHAMVEDQHRSQEFVKFLQMLISRYPEGSQFRVVLDNHSAHTSKETRAYLATVPGVFEFVFTPKHASWLNTIECFFSKVARSVLRGIRVNSLAELKERILRYFEEINKNPVLFKLGFPPDRCLRHLLYNDI